MAIRITFDLEDKDLKYFRGIMKKAQEAADTGDESGIISKAREMVDEVSQSAVPAFVRQRVESVRNLVDMLEDEEWALETKERKNVLSALAYFSDPQDLIPDNVPVLGYIDDAIMIELVVSELKHEIEAFTDFCGYRDGEKARNRNQNLSREEYLAIKRRELHQRMRRRRQSARSRARRSGTRPRFRLF
ncbi:MAG: YkvA family protein [Pseudomonadota bacterium]